MLKDTKEGQQGTSRDAGDTGKCFSELGDQRTLSWKIKVVKIYFLKDHLKFQVLRDTGRHNRPYEVPKNTRGPQGDRMKHQKITGATGNARVWQGLQDARKHLVTPGDTKRRHGYEKTSVTAMTHQKMSRQKRGRK